MATNLYKKIKTASELLTWDRKCEGLAAVKIFDSALSPKIKFHKEYQDLEGMTESTMADKILKKEVK